MNLKKSTLMLSMAAFSTAVAAQQNFEEITVEGQYLSVNQANSIKTPTPIIDVPQSLSIISAEQITTRGITSIGEIIDYIPGVNTSQGEGHRDAVVFRGVRSTADFYLDGNRDDVQYHRGLYNAEQVEILRGPNALLFGRGGTGGIINRVSKKAQLDDQFTGYKATLNTFGGIGGEIDTNFITSDTSAVRINAMYEGLENHRDFFGGDRIGFNPTARFELGSDSTLDLSYEYVDHERFIDRGIPTGADGRPVEAFEEIVFGDPDVNTTELAAHILLANLQHQFTDSLKGNFNASYADYDKLYQNFYASGYDQTATPDVVTLDGYVDTTQRKNLILSANLINEFNTGSVGHTIVAGAEYIDTSNDNGRYNARWSSNGFTDDNDVFNISRPLSLTGGTGVNANGDVTTNNFFADGALNDNTESDVEVLSVFIRDEISLNDNFDIVLGVRFDSFDQSTTNLVSSVVADRKDSEISPRLGFIYKPQENTSIYLSYSESFLPRSGEQFASTGSLDPDIFESAEIGVKWDFADGLSFTAAYFQNEQIRADRDDSTGEDFEIRGLEIDGFEAQFQGQVTEQLYLMAGYSHLNGETDQGREIPRELPENTFSLWGTYQVTSAFGLGLGVTYQDESFITDFDIGSTGTHPTLPSYTRVDASAYYDVSEDLRIQLNIDNLTDELYFPNAHSTHQATVGAPINAMLTVVGRF